MAHQIQVLSLSADANGIVKYSAPDGKVYFLDPRNPSGPWETTPEPNTGKFVMAYRSGVDAPNGDGELVLSLDGAISSAATLLHDGDDTPRKYYFATDEGNGDHPLRDRKVFILSIEGHKGCPVLPWAGLRIMLVK